MEILLATCEEDGESLLLHHFNTLTPVRPLYRKRATSLEMPLHRKTLLH